MNTQTQTFETLSVDQLAPVSGGGMISTIAGMFGPKGQQFGQIAENIFSMFKGGSSGGSSSGGSSSGGGLSSILGGLGGLGKLFGGSSSGGSTPAPAAPADASAGSGPS